VTSHPFVANVSDGPISGTVEGDGPPLLLLHGGPGLTDYMSALGAEIRGWRAISYQQRGLAPSTLSGPFTIESHVADAIAVLDELGIEQAVVLGHSWGGHLALHLALAAPDRVTGLVLVDSLGAAGDGGVVEMGQHLGERLLPENVGAYTAVSERLGGPEPTEDDMTESLRLLWPGYFADPAAILPFSPDWRLSFAAYAGTFGSVAEHLSGGFAAKLAGIGVPAVLVLGAKSPMPVSQGEQTAALLPDAEVMIVPDAGHLPWVERPGCVADALSKLAAR
jgi:pimeloyl-ACP methyl ester carboxylesterase